jgi:ABC-type proline/glycine betaine transport system substrate-binding protein
VWLTTSRETEARSRAPTSGSAGVGPPTTCCIKPSSRACASSGSISISAKLESKNPGAFRFLQKFKLTDLDQNTITQAKNVDGLSIEEASQKWVDDNESVWKPWLS